MALAEIKERFREEFQTLLGRVQESSAWNQLTEKYQDLSPNAQKAVLAGVAFLFVFLVLMFPWYFYSSSNDQLAQVDEKKGLIREAFRVARADRALPPLPHMLGSGELRSSAEQAINGMNLQPDQRGLVQDFQNKSAPGLPKVLEQNGLSISVNKLNLKQVTELGSKLQGIAPTVKTVGFEIRANKSDNHYFDVTYRLVAFALPPEAPAKGPKGKKGFGSGNED